MKGENEQLRRENLILKEKIVQLEEKIEMHTRRPRSDSAARSYDGSSNESQRERAKAGDKLGTPPSAVVPSSLEPAVQNTDFSPAREALSTHFSTPAPPAADDVLGYAAIAGSSAIDSFQCILCSPNAPCRCRETVLQQV
ncbi:hypothetical protein M404DRAFT_997224, partial [Pisolithus tinctorius Marx 270]